MLLTDMSNAETLKDVNAKSDDAPVSPNKTEKQPLIGLRNGKVVFSQKPLTCEKMSETMQEIVQFRNFLEKRSQTEKTPLQHISEEHEPLIAKLGHESDKTISFLAKRIQEALQPAVIDAPEDTQSAGASLSTAAIENAILRVCDRVNYGVDWTDKASAPLSVWRWELKENMYDYLPKASREKFESRLIERRRAKQELKILFDALPQPEKDLLMKSGKRAKLEGMHVLSITDENKPSTTCSTDIPPELKQHDLKEDNPDAKKGVGRPKKDKSVDAERSAKEKERAEKKAAKEERERKQQEAYDKSRSIMSSFFAKPKASSVKHPQPVTANPSLNDPSSSKSEFEKAFKPFVQRKDATMAPINYFHEKKAKEIIVIDQDACSGLADVKPECGDWKPPNADPQQLLAEYVTRVSPKSRRPRKAFNVDGPNYKSSSAYCVRDIFANLSEAEVLGDDATVRSLHALLRSRVKIPAKVLIFHEDFRPGYYGTFTKSSAVVGPRTPFARDALAFDYGYDSGEDWEEEEDAGEGLESANGSDAGETSDVGSDDMDDWLVDDDEPVDPGTPLSERAGSPALPLPLEPVPKRKAAEGESKDAKKRRVVPLVPFLKGPSLETNIGECDYEPFKQYRIQLFNDTPFPIDPFKFVSTPVSIERPSHSKPIFVVPALPAHVQAASSSTGSAPPSLPPPASGINEQPSTIASATTPENAKRVPLQPKNPFPPALLPYFADKVASLNSGNLTWLIESLYQDLRAHRVTKIAIEAKVRGDCEKCPARKVWVVKDDVLRSLGRAPCVPNT